MRRAGPETVDPKTGGTRRVYVALCRECADRLVGAQERRYVRIHLWAPAPGTMLVCGACGYRRGLSCTVPGLPAEAPAMIEYLGVQYEKPLTGVICFSGGRSERVVTYPGPAKGCARRTFGRE